MMRLITSCCMTASALLLCSSVASASNIDMSTTYGGAGLAVGETLSVVLELDADELGIQLLSVSVTVDPDLLQYNPQSNASVGVPTYILYGGSMPMSALFAQQDPWQYWPNPPAGRAQVNINWADASFNGTFVTGLGLKIGELEFEVLATTSPTTDIILHNDLGGNVFQVNGVNVGGIPIGGTPVTVNLPEATIGSLSFAALLSLYAIRRRAQN